MLYQLNYFQSLDQHIQPLEKHRSQLAHTITQANLVQNAYKYQKAVDNTLQTLWKQYCKFRMILDDIRMKVLLPESFSIESVGMFLGISQTLPDWFSYVFEIQYNKNRDQLNAMIYRLSTMHDLQSNVYLNLRKTWPYKVVKIRNVQSYRRFDSQDLLSELCENIQIYKDMVSRVKQSYRSFFIEITNRILDFFHLLFQNSLKINSQTDLYQHNHQYIQRNSHINTNIPKLHYSHRQSIAQSPLKFRILPVIDRSMQSRVIKYGSQDKYYKMSEKVMQSHMSPVRYDRESRRQGVQKRWIQPKVDELYSSRSRQSEEDPYGSKSISNNAYQASERMNWRSIESPIIKSSVSARSIQKMNRFDFRRFANVS